MVDNPVKTLAAVLFLLGIAHPSISALAEPMALMGVGHSKCTTLNQESVGGHAPDMVRNAKTAMIMGWLQGYLSGLNMGHSAATGDAGYFDLATISVEEEWAFLLNFCRENPDQQISDGALELMRKRLNWRQ